MERGTRRMGTERQGKRQGGRREHERSLLLFIRTFLFQTRAACAALCSLSISNGAALAAPSSFPFQTGGSIFTPPPILSVPNGGSVTRCPLFLFVSKGGNVNTLPPFLSVSNRGQHSLPPLPFRFQTGAACAAPFSFYFEGSNGGQLVLPPSLFPFQTGAACAAPFSFFHFEGSNGAALAAPLPFRFERGRRETYTPPHFISFIPNGTRETERSTQLKLNETTWKPTCRLVRRFFFTNALENKRGSRNSSCCLVSSYV